MEQNHTAGWGAGANDRKCFRPMRSVHLGGEQKRPLTPEEKERQKQLDDDYKAATNKTPDQKANDPWGFVRPAPTVPAPKKKQK